MRKHHTGMILIDAVLALSLGTLFIAILAGSSSGARSLFDRAHEENLLLDAFDDYRHGLFSSSSPSMIASSERPFGDDRIETDIAVSSLSQSVSFVRLAARDVSHLDETIGTPLCAADPAFGSVVGSYQFFNPEVSIPTSISITPIALPIDPHLPLTDFAVRDDIVYVSDDSSSASDPDLFVIDIHDRDHPKVVSSLDTGPGIAAITLSGRYIFTAATSRAAQLHIVRMDESGNLFLETKYRLPPPYATATEPVASSVFYDAGMLYLGTEKWDGNELSILNVSTPSLPNLVGGFETGSKVNDIAVRDSRAYLADSDQYQMRVLDVSHSSGPLLIDAFAPSGWQRQEGNTLALFEGSLTLGRTSGGFNIAADHEAFTWATSSSVSDQAHPRSVDIPGGVYGIVVGRSGIYLATRQIDREFQVFDRGLSSMPTISYPLPVAPARMTCDGSRLYILAATAPVIYEISFH